MNELAASIGRVLERLPISLFVAIAIPSSLFGVLLLAKKGWFDLKPAPLPPGDPAVDGLKAKVNELSRRVDELTHDIEQHSQVLRDAKAERQSIAAELNNLRVAAGRLEGRMDGYNYPPRS